MNVVFVQKNPYRYRRVGCAMEGYQSLQTFYGSTRELPKFSQTRHFGNAIKQYVWGDRPGYRVRVWRALSVDEMLPVLFLL
jgi:hypothetical protein